MEKVHWENKYVLGIDEIDDQHHFFVNMINRLSSELGRDDNLEYQAALISELNAYVAFHFISEENMMTHVNYPQLEEHRAHHQELLTELSNRELKLNMNRTAEEVEKIIQFLTEWFFIHTSKEDRKLAEFLKQ